MLGFGITHIQLAEHLHNILQLALSARKNQRLGLSVPIQIDYEPENLFKSLKLQVG